MTEDITTNKGTNSIHENSNVNATAINNLESNILHSQLNGEFTGQPESVTSVSDKKSFHITSVTVQRNSTDGNADESADESRTEDLSDNIDMSTANVQAQTPGFSENIIRKDDVLYKVTSVGSAPIIPTSAQYGIAVVSNPNAEFVENLNKFATDCKLSDSAGRIEFAQNGIDGNCGTALAAKELNAKNERFKVVKIESNEPFKRGRWVCMDFLDQSMDQAKKAATALNETEKSKRKEAEKESDVIINGATNPENMTTNDMGHKAETEKAPQLGQVAESTSHVNGDVSNSVSPNQTFTTPFVPPANVTQPQAQSLTHIIVPQGTQPTVASGSYGHSQSLPHSELQHVHQNSQQQQPMHVPSSLQQSFHQHTAVQHSQGLISQNIQHMSAQQQQSEPVYSQLAMQQQQPLLQQQYQPMQQSSQQRVQSTQQPLSSQPQQHSNPHCISQIPQQQGNQSMPPPQSNTEQLLQQPPSQSVQQPSNQQFQQNQPSGQQQQQPLQHPMQQVPMQQQQQQTFQPQNAAQQIIHQSVQQHHSSQQSSQASVQQMVAAPQTTPATSQQSMQPSNMQQSVHMSTQPAVSQPPVQSSVQFLPQQSSSLPPPVIQQTSSQQPNQPVLSQPQPQQLMQQQSLPGGGDQQLHMQPMQQQQMLPQQMQPQMPQQQQQQQQQIQQSQHQQPIPHIPQQTIPQQQQPSQPIQQPQQMQMQPQQMQQQQLPQQQQHHQQMMQPVPQQPQQQQQPPPQAQLLAQTSMQHSAAAGFQNPQQTQPLPPAGQQQGPQVVQQQQQCVTPQQIASIAQSLPPQLPIPPPSHQQPQQTQTLQQPLQSAQSMQHALNQQMPPTQSINGGQVMQPQYQGVTAAQMSDQSIPVSASQPTYQHDVVLPNLAQSDVIMSNQYQQLPTQHQLHVSLQQQQYANPAPASHYVNAPSVNMVSTSMSSQQQTQPPPQFYSHQQVSQSVLPPCSQPSCSVASQDLQQMCAHQPQGMATMTQQQPPLMSVSSQNLPSSQPTIQNGSQQQHTTQSLNQPSVGHQSQNLYPVHSQNLYPQNGGGAAAAVSSQTSAHVQTQTTPNAPQQQPQQPCSTAGVPMSHYAMQPAVLSLTAQPVPPVSTTYVTNIGAVHPSQLPHGYVAGVPPAQCYPGGGGGGHSQCGVPFVDPTSGVEYHGQPSSHFPEQVAEYMKNEETSFQRPNEDAESTAGSTNAVAIDNKIEQAMDLVKSHLMFAVREEVEVLKEKIAELMDRINQLEMENSILKANASQDTLAQLPTHQPTATTATSASSTRPPSGPTSGQPP